MEIEYLPDGSPDCPLIRIFNFDSTEVRAFHDLIVDLSNGKLDQIDLHDQPFINQIEGCALTLIASENDEGIVSTGKTEFQCHLGIESWMNVADLVAPFNDTITGYQWLDETSEISLLLSPNGKW